MSKNRQAKIHVVSGHFAATTCELSSNTENKCICTDYHSNVWLNRVIEISHRMLEISSRFFSGSVSQDPPLEWPRVWYNASVEIIFLLRLINRPFAGIYCLCDFSKANIIFLEKYSKNCKSILWVLAFAVYHCRSHKGYHSKSWRLCQK